MKVRIRQFWFCVLILLGLFQSCLSNFLNWFQYFDEAIVVVLLVCSLFQKTGKKKRNDTVIGVGIILFCFCGIVSHIVNSGKLSIHTLFACFLSAKFLLYFQLMAGLKITGRDEETIYKVILSVGFLDTYIMVLSWFAPALYEGCFLYERPGYRLGIPVSQGIFSQLAMNAFFLMFLSLYYFVKYILASTRKRKHNILKRLHSSRLALR